MTLYTFSLLDKEDQELMISDDGTFLATREADGIMFDLYHLETFYVEFLYHTNGSGNMVVRCFTSTEELAAYDDILDISQFI
jgi:hypothetical protein